jgi:hypothetical protein
LAITQDRIDFDLKKSEAEKAFHYKILTHYENKDVSGTADVFFKNLEHYNCKKCRYSNSVYKDCLKKGLGSEDIICHLKFFYPNGGKFRKEYMRNGVGRITLDHIIEDVSEQNGKMIYVFSTTEFMENFLNKHHFEHSSNFDFQYYLYI